MNVQCPMTDRYDSKKITHTTQGRHGFGPFSCIIYHQLKIEKDPSLMWKKKRGEKESINVPQPRNSKLWIDLSCAIV